MSISRLAIKVKPLLIASPKLIIRTKKISGIPNLAAFFYNRTELSTKLFTSSQRCFSQESIDDLTVDFDYVKTATQSDNTLIIDVREPEEVKDLGQIPNSINIPLGSVVAVLSTVTDKEFQEIFDRKKPSDDTEIIFYCMIGKRSGKAQKEALNLGFKNAKNYLGSWTDWASKTN